jgi:hypothetical protein
MRPVRRAGLVLALLVLAAMPVGAGATGHGPLAMLAFAGLFLLANAVIRPASVTLSLLLPQAMTAAAFAALLVGLGQGMRATAGIATDTALFGWVFAGAWAAVLARLVWPPKMTDRLAGGAETALREVHRRGEAMRRRRNPASAEPGRSSARAPAPATPNTNEQGATASRAAKEADPGRKGRAPDPALAEGLARLDALPEDGAPDADLRDALDTLSAAGPPDRVVAALFERGRPDRPARDRRALALHVTAPAVAEARSGMGDPAAAFEEIVASADAASLGTFLSHALALLEEMPEARTDMPEVARLLEISDQIDATHEAEAELLVTLAHLIEDLSLAAERGADA